MIIDAHHHLWDLSQKKHSWLINDIEDSFLGDYQAIRKDYLLQNYLQNAKNINVTKSIHVQAGWDKADPVGETAWLQAMADKHGFPHGIVAFADFTSDDIEKTLAEHSQFTNVRGIRQILNWHENPYLSGCAKDYANMSIWQRNFGLLAKYNLSFDAQIYPSQMDTIIKLAKLYPDIQIVLNHAGMPLFKHKVTNFEVWKNNLKQLALFSNITIKISGFGMFDHNWTVEKIKPLILTTIDIFGIERCMFASNFPVDTLYSNLDKSYDACKNIMEKFSVTEKQKFFYDNAERIYRLF